MSDMLSRRMAYRNAARAAFYANESTKEEEEKKPETLKVYHAHGYVVYSDNCASGDEIWDRDSAFSEVFFDFETAKKYLLAKFEERLHKIYHADKMFEGLPEEERDISKASEHWRKEYISEYIDYVLEISELTSEYDAENTKTDFTNPQKIDWYLRYNGEVRTRYFSFGDKEYECRETDLLPTAGTKFKVGDLVEYSDWEFGREYLGILVVLNAPQKPQDKTTPWENNYELVYIENCDLPKNSGHIAHLELHEADLKLCNDIRLNHSLNKETISALQRAVRWDEGISLELREDILRGRVLFNEMPSWRDCPELKKE